MSVSIDHSSKSDHHCRIVQVVCLRHRSSWRAPDDCLSGMTRKRDGAMLDAAMPRAPRLPPRIKVFRTHIGLYDWVVATSSQKAALEAWDVSRNLFATGEAEITNDPKAVKLALDNLGKAVAMPLPKGRRS